MSNYRPGFLFVFSLLFLFLRLAHSQTPDYSGSPNRLDTSSSFIFVGDVQLRGKPEILLGREDNKDAVRALLKKIADEDPSFVLILGDLTFPGSSIGSWHDLDELAKPIRDKNIPVFPLPGNHEYFGNHLVAFEEYFARFPKIDHALWYSKRWKDIGIITLDANFSFLSKDQRDDQRSWYLSEMKNMQQDSGIAIIIVCCHEPPFTNSTIVSDDKDVQKYFVPAYLHTSKAKLFFCGHCHSYEHFRISGKDFVVSGGGGPRQKLRTPPKDSPKQDLFQGGSLRKHHFCKLIRTATGLNVQMTQMDEDLKTWSVGEEIVVMK
ncbi:MAG: metallophosphoesterase family protein [Candidatus Kapaibacterium sp.]